MLTSVFRAIGSWPRYQQVLLMAALLLRLLLMGLFSSGYSDEMFRPFLTWFVETGQNPYQHFAAQADSAVAFPYPPLMLYLMSTGSALISWLGIGSVFWQNLLFKLPLLLADVALLWLLASSLRGYRLLLLVGWLFSPILLYSTYAHSQLDIIPTTLFFASAFRLHRHKLGSAAVLLALALATKLHLLAIMPFVLIYIYRQWGIRPMLGFTGTVAGLWGLLSLPFSLDASFWQYTFGDKQPQLLYDTFYQIGTHQVYLPVLALVLLTLRFANYRKHNYDLLISYLTIAFALFVILISPSPAWYVWMMPFLVLFFVKQGATQPKLLYFFGFVQLVYLLYFLGFHHGATYDLAWLGVPLTLPLFTEAKQANLIFTMLLGSMGVLVFVVYRLGLRSNQVYKKRFATVLGVGGDSGTGKSTLMADLKAMLGSRAQELEGDADHRWERGHANWKHYTHLDPKANQLHDQATQIKALKFGRAILRRDYDHATGRFTTPNRVVSKDFILLSGLHPFYLPQMRELVDVKIYLDTEEQLRRHWKILRDTRKRGYSPAQIIEQIEARMPDAERHIYPQREHADLVISYFTEEEFTPGDLEARPHLQLQLTFSTGLPAEPLLDVLYPLELDWNYQPDLRTQILRVPTAPQSLDVEAAAHTLIPNLYELTGTDMQWQTGYRGLIQLVVLYLLSHKMIQHD